MAGDVNDITRVQALASGHAEAVETVKTALGKVSTLPLFIRHPNGSIQTRAGKVLREPTPQRPSKP